MKMTDKIDLFMKFAGISNYVELSRITGVPYTTIKGFYDKGYNNAKRETLVKLKIVMGLTLDELSDDNIDIDMMSFQKTKTAAELNLNSEARLLFSKYNQLSRTGQTKVIQYIDDLLASGNYDDGGEICATVDTANKKSPA